jgi:transcriptional regulator with XRE-family HTH domain
MGMDQLYREFGRLLRQRRKDAHLSQDEVANSVGLARTSITNIETGRQHVSLHMLYALANAVGARPHELLPDSAILLQEDPRLERAMDKRVMPEDEKDWIRRLVSKTRG